MNLHLLRLGERLTIIEKDAKLRHARVAQDPGHTLRQLVADPEAMDLYTKALVETEKMRCRHQRYGWCPACLDGSQAVRLAWQAFQTRMEQISSQPTKETNP